MESSFSSTESLTNSSDSLRIDQYVRSSVVRSVENESELVPFLVPRFIQAIVTLILCTLLIGITLCVITQLKKLCVKRGNNSSPMHLPLAEVMVQTHKEKGPSVPAPAVVVSAARGSFTDTPILNTEITKLNPTQKSDVNSNGRMSKRKRLSRDKTVYLKVPGLDFVRRPSGPFGEETLAFVRETYRKPVKPPSPEPGIPGSHQTSHYN